MGPMRQNPIQKPVSLFICVCIALCTIVAHNIAQNRPDNFPPYPPDNHHISDDVYLREGGLPTASMHLELEHNKMILTWSSPVVRHPLHAAHQPRSSSSAAQDETSAYRLSLVDLH